MRVPPNPPKRILVISLRYLGDTLLVTPLIHSLQCAYPHARIDVLISAGNAGILEGNTDVASVLKFNMKPSWAEVIHFLKTRYKAYDLAISTQTSDRSTLLAALTGKFSISFVSDSIQKSWWAKLILTRAIVFKENHDHAVLENLRFCSVLNIPRKYSIRPPQSKIAFKTPATTPYAVLHIMPQWRYKQWHHSGWLALMRFLHQRGYTIVLSGSPEPDEKARLNSLQSESKLPILNLAGQLSLAQLTDLIRNAEVFIGPDTGITHLAAATGTLTIAFFGPTDPAKWAPWPANYPSDSSPFSSRGSQRVGNVFLIQGRINRDCMPCQREGCQRHRNSSSECLDNLSEHEIIKVLSQALDEIHTKNTTLP